MNEATIFWLFALTNKIAFVVALLFCGIAFTEHRSWFALIFGIIALHSIIANDYFIKRMDEVKR